MFNPLPRMTRAYLDAVEQAAQHPDDLGLAATVVDLGTMLDEYGRVEAEAVEARLGAPDALATAAEFYASRGWPVFPLTPEGKVPATRRGFKDATTDVERVRAWWGRNPEFNIGTPTGEDGCGLDVVDLDGREGVLSTYGDEEFLASLDVVARSRTTRPGGWHLWIPARGYGNRAAMLPGVDYRGNGGYVVIPCSRTRGRRYGWIDVPPALVRGQG